MNAGRDQDDQGNAAPIPASSSAAQRTIPIVDHRIDSRNLFVATREVTISHGDDLYRLRLTGQNKLILTK